MKSRLEYNYFILPKAQMELLDAFEWYGLRSLSAAKRLRSEVDEGLDFICRYPYRWKATDKEYREFLLNTYPYSIVYLVNDLDRTVLVVSVFHHKRHPKRKLKT